MIELIATHPRHKKSVIYLLDCLGLLTQISAMSDEQAQVKRNYRAANITLDVAELVSEYCAEFEREHNVPLSFSAACNQLIRQQLAVYSFK